MANNDPSALAIWGLTREPFECEERMVHGVKIILLFSWSDYLAFDALAKAVFDICTAGDGRVIPGCPARFTIDELLCEDTAAGRPVVLELERIYNVSAKFGVELIRTGRLDHVARLQSIEHMFRAGMIYAPNKVFADAVIDQMSIFPSGAHDDLVDTASQALRWFRDQNLLTTKEEQFQETEQMGRYRSKLKALYPA